MVPGISASGSSSAGSGDFYTTTSQNFGGINSNPLAKGFGVQEMLIGAALLVGVLLFWRVLPRLVR